MPETTTVAATTVTASGVTTTAVASGGVTTPGSAGTGGVTTAAASATPGPAGSTTAPTGSGTRSVTRDGGGPFDARLIPEYDGSSDVVEWFTRAEVLCKHRGVDLTGVLPARLSGGAFAVWLQMPEDARDSADAVRDALYDAFAMDRLAAYDAYASRRLQPGESADVYLADLRRLASLYGGVPESALACAFISGLPDAVRKTIRAGTRAEALDLASILARARAVLSDERVAVAAAVAREDTSRRAPNVRMAKRPPRRCWTCGESGHIAATCPRREAGNAPGDGASAQAPSPCH